jgi:Domain of unknown function (DUF4177)
MSKLLKFALLVIVVSAMAQQASQLLPMPTQTPVSVKPEPVTKPLPVWEYKVFNDSTMLHDLVHQNPHDKTPHYIEQSEEEYLNQLGQQGWELINVVWEPHLDRRVYYLKREVKSQ